MGACPCKDCFNRTVTCHGLCSLYQEWKEQHEAELEAKRAEQYRFSGTTQRALAAWMNKVRRRKR